jgi:hypothetical protein
LVKIEVEGFIYYERKGKIEQAQARKDGRIALCSVVSS